MADFTLRLDRLASGEFKFCFWAAIPAVLTAVSAGASLIGTAVSATGQVQAGQQQQQAYDYNAQVQRQNATIATQEAQGQAKIDKTQTERNLGAIAAAYGGAGIDPTQGSPLMVMADQAATGELNRQLDLYRGSVQATSSTNQANLLTYQGAAARTAGNTAAAGTILSGVARVAPSVGTLFPSGGGNQSSTPPNDPTMIATGPGYQSGPSFTDY